MFYTRYSIILYYRFLSSRRRVIIYYIFFLLLLLLHGKTPNYTLFVIFFYVDRIIYVISDYYHALHYTSSTTVDLILSRTSMPTIPLRGDPFDARRIYNIVTKMAIGNIHFTFLHSLLMS